MEKKETQKEMKKSNLQRSLWATLVWAAVMLLWDGLEPGKFDVREKSAKHAGWVGCVLPVHSCLNDVYREALKQKDALGSRNRKCPLEKLI
ncbi:hypothetical protein [Paenibacillus sp. NFR01]|uniref:hypothetical protein n=1 Tax=Paenibacillus sp. NFR01 TaxID=1566279 RepID=UPI0008BE6DB4|nr:hypothetical protein [Paenibacillus sp. NFR01]SET28880.1 hypothetical protein SAMN03159358_1238 [Paenibacillus sp. NFR01]